MNAKSANPDFLKWLRECLARGHSPESLRETAVQAGWHPGIVDEALAEATGVALGGQGAGMGSTGFHVIPGPDLSESPNFVQLSDRKVDVVLVVQDPRIIVFGNVLSHQECDELIALAQPRLKRSLTVDTATGGEQLHADRTSDGMFFKRAEFPLVDRIERRLAELVRWPVENGEGIQVLRYRSGAQYVPHYDYFDPAQPGTARLLERGGQRVGTIVMYLRAPERGGATTFPDIGLEVAPVKGTAVFFSYDEPTPESKTLHGGAPATLGEKYVATKWMREWEFV